MNQLQQLALTASPFFWSCMCAVFYTLGDVLFRYFRTFEMAYGAAVLLVVYAAGTFFLVLSFFGQNIAVATVLGIVLNIIAYLAAAHFLFGDTLGYREFAGITLGIASIIVLEGFK